MKLEDLKMTTLKKFEEIEAWKKARVLAVKTYEISKLSKFSKDFGLRDQSRRSSVSIMANIAEGFERGGNREFVQFLSIAKASTAELRSHLYVALDQAYISEEDFKETYLLAEEVSKIIWGLMRYISGTNIKGDKFKSYEN